MADQLNKPQQPKKLAKAPKPAAAPKPVAPQPSVAPKPAVSKPAAPMGGGCGGAPAAKPADAQTSQE